MHARKIVVLLAYFLTLLLTVAVAKKYDSDNKRGPNQSAFKTMMRYGRSGNSHDKDGGKVQIRPRADAFFLGPRYGKRSSWSPPSPSLVYPVSAPLCGLDEDLSCAYTGVSDLYRCTPRKEDFSTRN